MSLEGNLRDLALPEVCQLLAHTRKSGELRLKAPLVGLHAHILFNSGAIVGAEINNLGVPIASDVDVVAPDAAQTVERTTLELLCWKEGEFRFVPHSSETGPMRTGVRLHTEMLLMEGARRGEEWERLSDLIPNARAVPAFVDVEPRQLPLLNLQPQQWEVLTGVDGQRDLSALARALGRDLLEVAEVVHALIGTGLLKLADASRVQRTQATPPSSAAQPDTSALDLWVPENGGPRGDDDYDDDDANDEIFDPVRVGVISPDGLPRLRTPAQVARIARVRATSAPSSGVNTVELRELGDASARRGELSEALRYWSAILEWRAAPGVEGSEQANGDKTHAAEAIALVTRLQELLYANQPV